MQYSLFAYYIKNSKLLVMEKCIIVMAASVKFIYHHLCGQLP
jgi:hypothetical protein